MRRWRTWRILGVVLFPHYIQILGPQSIDHGSYATKPPSSPALSCGPSSACEIPSVGSCVLTFPIDFLFSAITPPIDSCLHHGLSTSVPSKVYAYASEQIIVQRSSRASRWLWHILPPPMISRFQRLTDRKERVPATLTIIGAWYRRLASFVDGFDIRDPSVHPFPTLARSWQPRHTTEPRKSI